MAINYDDPQESIKWLLNPNVALPETDTNAAQSAVGMGGMVGSTFAANNRLRLRDSERISRFALGQNLLQPYLNRASAEGMQSKEIAARSAAQAISEAGLDRRLSAEGNQRLQLAILSGNQQAAHDLLVESGANSRQAAALASNLQNTVLNNQQRNFEALLPYEQRNLDIRRASLPLNPSQQNPVVMNGGAFTGGYSPVTASGSPTRAPAAPNRTSANTLNMVDRILKQYGIGTSTETGRPPAPSAPPGEFNWGGNTSPENRALQDYYESAGSPGEYDWNAPGNRDVAALQNYYE